MYNNSFINELKQYLLEFTENDISGECGYCGNGRTIHRNFFSDPVKLIFYWEESSFEGEIYVLFKYKDKFIAKGGSFGSCCVCDYWEGTNSLKQLNDNILLSFNDIKIYNNLSDIKFNEYAHPCLVNNFNNFKKTYETLNKNVK